MMEEKQQTTPEMPEMPEKTAQPETSDTRKSVPPQRNWHESELQQLQPKPNPGFPTAPQQNSTPPFSSYPYQQQYHSYFPQQPQQQPHQQSQMPQQAFQQFPYPNQFQQQPTGQPAFQNNQNSQQASPAARQWTSQNNPQGYYQNPPRYAGWQLPPQMPPQTPLGKPPVSKEKKEKRAAFWLKIVAGLIVLLMVYFVISDIVIYRHGGNVQPTGVSDYTPDDSPKVVVQQQKKPDLPLEGKDVNEDGTYTVEGVAAAVRPSIVEIYTYADQKGVQTLGAGSGIILSEDGYIITNAHVLTNGKSFSVVTSDEKELKAQVIGSDAKTDLAVIKIESANLSPATLGDSDEVVLGESVVAIGNPAGLSGSVTNGIVSGLNRQIRADSTGFNMNCIQTNAAISPGNSGGALVNMYGQVIGITSSKYVSSSYEGLGFAITINEVLPIVEDLIANGHVSDRVRIGISFVGLENDYLKSTFAEQMEIKDVPTELEGLWITEIAEDCDIAQTELQINDVIVSVEGTPVTDYSSLCEAIEGKKPDTQVQAECRRYEKSGEYESFSIQFRLMEDTSGNF